MYGVCKICGCTENDPCYHPDWGMCWWVDDTHELCSHCADPEIADDPDTCHCVNSTDSMKMGVPDLNETCADCVHMLREENECMVEKCKFERRAELL